MRAPLDSHTNDERPRFQGEPVELAKPTIIAFELLVENQGTIRSIAASG